MSEETTEKVTLTECEGNVGRLAKLLATDTETYIIERSISDPSAFCECCGEKFKLSALN